MSFTMSGLSSVPGAIGSVTLENAGLGSLAGGYTTLGQTFAPGQLPSGGSLMAMIGGASVPVQVDVKSTWPDGSAKMVVLTLERPPLAAGVEVPVVFVAGTAPQGGALDMMQKLAGHSFDVTLAPVGQATMQVDVLQALQDALKAGTASFWQQGPLASQARVEVDVPNSSLRLVFDVTVFADGQFKVDAQFNNDRAMELVGGRMQYGVTIRMDGQQVASEALDQGQYQNWHTAFSSDPTNGGQGLGSPTAGWLNIVQDVAKLGALGVVPDYDLSLQIPEARLSYYGQASAQPSWQEPLASNDVTTYMPMTGGRGDIGFVTEANASWLISGDARAAAYALGQAEAASSVPWHFYDNAKGTWINSDSYPDLWTDGRGGTGTPGDPTSRGLTQQVDPYTGWTTDVAHEPSLSFVPYVMTGERWMLDNLQAQAVATVIGNYWPARGESGELVVYAQQIRASAWAMRELEDAAWASPEGSAERAYFRSVADTNWSWIVSKLPEWTAEQGEAHGRLGSPGTYSGGAEPPWQQDFFASTAILAASRGNADAKTYLNWAKNWLIGRFEHAAEGFNPRDGIAYIVVTVDAATGKPYTTWAEIGAATAAAGYSNGTGWDFSAGYYGQLGLATLAAIYRFDGDPRALNAYNWLLSQNPSFTSDADFANGGTQYAVLLSDNLTVDPTYPTDTNNTNTGTNGSTGGTTNSVVESPKPTVEQGTVTNVRNVSAIEGSAGFDTVILADDVAATLTVVSVERLRGSALDDVVTVKGTIQNGDYDLGAGYDTLRLVSAGPNTITIRNAEVVQGSAGDDVITLGTVATDLRASLGAGNDKLVLSSAGPNSIVIEDVETVIGGSLDDLVAFAAPAEGTVLHLGDGNDTVVLSTAGANRVTLSGVERIQGGTAADEIVLASPNQPVDGGSPGARSIILDIAGSMSGTAADEAVTFTQALVGATIDLAAGQDTLYLSSSAANTVETRGVEAVFGGTASDSVTVVALTTSQMTVDLGAGSDRLVLSVPGLSELKVVASNVETIIGGASAELIVLATPALNAVVDLGDGKDRIELGNFNNVISVANVETVIGNDGADRITVTAGAGSRLSGGAGLDTLIGGANNDTLIGGSGADTLTGGAGRDQFLFLTASDSRSSAMDRITDFNASQDFLAFDDLLTGTFAYRGTAGFTASGNTEARYSSGSRVIQLDFNGDGRSDLAVQLDNVFMSTITASNFLWV